MTSATRTEMPARPAETRRPEVEPSDGPGGAFDRGRAPAAPQEAIWTILSIGGSVALFGGAARAGSNADAAPGGPVPTEDEEAIRADQDFGADPNAPGATPSGADAQAADAAPRAQSRGDAGGAANAPPAPMPVDDGVFVDTGAPPPGAPASAEARYSGALDGPYVKGSATAATPGGGQGPIAFVGLDSGAGLSAYLGTLAGPYYDNVQSVVAALEGRLNDLGAMNPATLGSLSGQNLDIESILGVSLDDLFESLIPTSFMNNPITQDADNWTASPLQQSHLELTEMSFALANYSLLGPSISLFDDLVAEDGAPLEATVGGGSAALGEYANANGFAASLGFQTPSADLVQGQATFVAEGEEVASTTGADVSGADVIIVYQHEQDINVGGQKQTISTTAVNAINYPGFDFANGPIVAVKTLGGDFANAGLVNNLNPGVMTGRGPEPQEGTSAFAEFAADYWDDFDFGDVVTTGTAATATDPGSAAASATAGVGIEVF